MVPVLVYLLVVTSTSWVQNGTPKYDSYIVDNIVSQQECEALGAKITAAGNGVPTFQCYAVTKAH